MILKIQCKLAYMSFCPKCYLLKNKQKKVNQKENFFGLYIFSANIIEENDKNY